MLMWVFLIWIEFFDDVGWVLSELTQKLNDSKNSTNLYTNLLYWLFFLIESYTE